MELFGRTLDDFLDNLDSMHGRVALSFPDLKPPKFRREALPDGTTLLHYHSDRAGLAPMVIGLLRGLANRFNESIAIEMRTSRDDGSDHDVVAIRRLD